VNGKERTPGGLYSFEQAGGNWRGKQCCSRGDGFKALGGGSGLTENESRASPMMTMSKNKRAWICRGRSLGAKTFYKAGKEDEGTKN